jgi:hypothetical protein
MQHNNKIHFAQMITFKYETKLSFQDLTSTHYNPMEANKENYNNTSYNPDGSVKAKRKA